MSISQIVEAILKEAEKEAEKILQEAEFQCQKLLDEAGNQINNKKIALIKEKEKEISQQVDKILTEAKLEAKKIILEAKRQILDDIYRSLLERLDKSIFPKKKRIFFDRVVEDYLTDEEFIQEIKEKFEPELIRILKLNEIQY